MIISKGEIKFSEKLIQKHYYLTCMMEKDFYYGIGADYPYPLKDMRAKSQYINLANKL